MTAPRPPASLEEVLAVLRARKEDVRREAGVELVGVVGSLARGEARADSDVDVIVREFGEVSLFGLIRAEASLGRALRRPVEMVFSAALNPERRAWIERDLRPL